MKHESDDSSNSAELHKNGIEPSQKIGAAAARNHSGVITNMSQLVAPESRDILDYEKDRLLSVDEVAERLNVTKDWVWDHSSRKSPLLPVIRIGDGTLRYRASKIEEFINERERLSFLRGKRR